MAFSTESLIMLSLGCLVLNYFAFRNSEANAGHRGRQIFKMAVAWLAIIVGLTVVVGLVDR